MIEQKIDPEDLFNSGKKYMKFSVIELIQKKADESKKTVWYHVAPMLEALIEEIKEIK